MDGIARLYTASSILYNDGHKLWQTDDENVHMTINVVCG
jgi:hypothetical protein